MNQRYVEVTRQSWGQRLGKSIQGVLVGIVMVLAGVGLLFWNEGRSVKRAQALSAGADKVVSIEADRLQPGFDGQLIHTSGQLAVDASLRDPVFGVEANGLLLEREVEMYQWQEESRSREEKKVGGGSETITTYEYKKVWSSRPIDSSSFRHPEGRVNPGSFPYGSEQLWADQVTLGELGLASTFVSSLAQKERIPLASDLLEGAPDESVRTTFQVVGGELYRGQSPSAPQIGDLRVRFHVAPVGVASVVGELRGGGLVAHAMDRGQSIALAQRGNLSAGEMFAAAQAANRALAWMLRGAGFLLLVVGFASILKPLSVLADVIPFIGTIVGMGTTMVAFALGGFLALTTIALGWLLYRPLLGITLLLAAGALAFWLVRALLQRRGAGAAVQGVPTAAVDAGVGAPAPVGAAGAAAAPAPPPPSAAGSGP
jgi:hypothetical protein